MENKIQIPCESCKFFKFCNKDVDSSSRERFVNTKLFKAIRNKGHLSVTSTESGYFRLKSATI